MSELRPCPFCGGKADFFLHSAGYDEYVALEIDCSECSAGMEVWVERYTKTFEKDVQKKKEEMFAEWNKRTEQEWIPVSERLPEYCYVLVSTDANEVFIAHYLGKRNDGTACFDDDDGMMWEGDVIAWKPLPEPYRAESESEK